MGKPTLWHIPASHYSEKVRWALAYKGVEHTRVFPPPGVHMPLALALSRGKQYTLPILRMDGRFVGDSTAIIEALEERFPEPPLYPADPDERARALMLEDYFDETTGPAVRQLAFHALRADRERFEDVVVTSAPRPLRRLGPVVARYMRAFTGIRFKAGDAKVAERSRAAIRESVDRLEGELDGGEYLVGGRFSVADLTAAAILYPLVLPPGAPLAGKQPPAGLARFIDELGGPSRPALAWVEEMYRRHRRPQRTRTGAAAA